MPDPILEELRRRRQALVEQFSASDEGPGREDLRGRLKALDRMLATYNEPPSVTDPKVQRARTLGVSADEIARRAGAALAQGLPRDVTTTMPAHIMQDEENRKMWKEAMENSRRRQRELDQEAKVAAGRAREAQQMRTGAPRDVLPEKPPVFHERPGMVETPEQPVDPLQASLKAVHRQELEVMEQQIDQVASALSPIVPAATIKFLLGVGRGAESAINLTANLAALAGVALPEESETRQFLERRAERADLGREVGGLAGGLGQFAGFMAPYVSALGPASAAVKTLTANAVMRQGPPILQRAGLYLFRHPRLATALTVGATEVPFSLARQGPALIEAEGLDDVSDALRDIGLESMFAGAFGMLFPPIYGKPKPSPSLLGLEAMAEGAERAAETPLRMFKGRLEHWSHKKGLSRLDPEHMGEGRATRTDMTQATGGPKLVYTYREGMPPEPVLKQPLKYTTEDLTLPIYDIGTDPDGLVQAYTQAYRLQGATRWRLGPAPGPGEIYKYLFELGYDGFMMSNHVDEYLRNAVVLFRGVNVGQGVESAVTRNLYRGRAATQLGVRSIDEQASMLRMTATAQRQLEEMAYAQRLLEMQRGMESRAALDGIKDFAKLSFEAGSAIIDNVRTLLRNEGLRGTIQQIARRVNNEAGFARVGRQRPNGFTEYPAEISRAAGDVKAYRNPAAVQGVWLTYGEGLKVGSPEWTRRMVDLYGSGILNDMPKVIQATEKAADDILSYAVNNEVPTLKKLLEMYHAGEDVSRWYNASLDEMRGMMGEDAEVFLGILAATSANTAIDANITLATKAFNIWKMKGRLPTVRDKFMRDQVAQIRRAIKGEPLNGPKVGPFLRALLGDENAVVVDLWMMRAFNFNRMVPTKAKKGGTYPTTDEIRMVEHAVPNTKERQFVESGINSMADQLGVSPREAQAGLWVGAKRIAGDAGPVYPYETVLRTMLRVRQFSSEPDLATALRDNDWVALSAHRAGMSAKESAEAMKKMQVTLRQMGYKPIKADGMWFDDAGKLAPEPSFLVPALTETEAVMVARQFGQQSIATQRGIITVTDDGFGRLAPWTNRDHTIWQGRITKESPFHPDNMEQAGIFGYTKVKHNGKVHYFSGHADFDVSVPAFPYIKPSPAARARGTLETLTLERPLKDMTDAELISTLKKAIENGERFNAARASGEQVIGNLDAAAYDIQQIRNEIWKRHGIIIREGEAELGGASPELLQLLAASGSGAALGAAAGAAIADDPVLGATTGAVIGGAGAAALLRAGQKAWRMRRTPRPAPKPEYRPPPPPKLPKPTAFEPGAYVPEELINLSKIDIDPAILDPTGLKVLKEEVERAASQRSTTFKETVSWTETRARAQAIAQRLGLDPNAVRPRAGRLAGEEMLAIENIVSRNTQKIIELGNQVKNPAMDIIDRQVIEHNVAALREQNNHLLGMLMEARTQAGRDLNSLRILANRNFEDVDWWVIQARNMLGNTPEPPTMYNDIAAFIRQGDREGLVKYIQGMRQAPWDEKLVTLWKAGLLSAPPTHLANLVGNLSMATLEMTKEAPAILYDRFLSTILRNTVRTKAGVTSLAPVARASMRGTMNGLQEALHVMGIRDFGRELRAGRIGSAFGALRGNPITDALTKWDMYRYANFNSPVLDIYTKMVFNSLTAGDRLFRNIAIARSMEAQLRALAEQSALRTGLRINSKAGKEHVAKLLSQWQTNPPPGVMTNAIADAEVAIFLNSSKLARAASFVKRPFGSAGDLIIPFAKTPANIATMVVEYSPVGATRVVWDTFKLLLNRTMPPAEARALQQATAERFGRSLTGSALVWLGSHLAERGLMTGAIPRSQTEKQQWDHEGRAPNAILVDGQWRSVERLSPLGNLLALGANAWWIFQDDELSASEKLEQSVMSIGRTVTEQSFLKGANAFIETMQGDRKVGTFAQQLAGSVVPSVVSRAARVVDPVRRAPNDPFEAVLARFPYLSRLVPAKINQFGQEQQWNQGPFAAFFDLLYSRPDMTRDDEVLAEMQRVGAAVGLPGQEDDETDEDYQARLIAYGKEWERHIRYVIQTPAYQRIDEQARRLGERFGLPADDIVSLGVEMQRYAIESEATWVRSKLDEMGRLGRLHTEEAGGRITERVTNRLVNLRLEQRAAQRKEQER